MIHEEKRLHLLRWERIARVKRILRLMPRRATMHRYPVIRWFARSARRRMYLWSFRISHAVPAIYAGCILALLPIYGIQLPIAVGLAFLLRANLPILFSLQFITNPLTVWPIYFACYRIGRVILTTFGFDTPTINKQGMHSLYDSMVAGGFVLNFDYVSAIWLQILLGGSIIGTFLGAIGSLAYRLGAYEVTVLNNKIRDFQQKRLEAAQKDAGQSQTIEDNSNPDG